MRKSLLSVVFVFVLGCAGFERVFSSGVGHMTQSDFMRRFGHPVSTQDLGSDESVMIYLGFAPRKLASKETAEALLVPPVLVPLTRAGWRECVGTEFVFGPDKVLRSWKHVRLECKSSAFSVEVRPAR